MSIVKKTKKKITAFRVRLRTKNFTAEELREKLYTTFFPKLAIVRLGSLTPIEEITAIKDIVEINKPEAIEVSRDKKAMKDAFTQNKVKTADWWTNLDNNNFIPFNNTVNECVSINDLPYPILSKSRTGQGGSGNTLHKDQKSLEEWMNGKDLDNYIFEKYYNYAREYRLHCTQEGAFLVWRKMRKKDAKDRWYFNNDNCVWIGETNPLFDKPKNWDVCVQECVKALTSVGLDIGAVDIRIQSATDDDGNIRENPELIVLETGSAPALGKMGSEFYYKEIVKLINKKL